MIFVLMVFEYRAKFSMEKSYCQNLHSALLTAKRAPSLLQMPAVWIHKQKPLIYFFPWFTVSQHAVQNFRHFSRKLREGTFYAVTVRAQAL